MTRKNAIIILITIILFAVVFITYLIVTSNISDNNKNTGDSLLPNEFVFPGSNSTTTPITDNTPKEIPRLRQISPTPVSGFISFERKIDLKGEIVPESRREQTETIYRFIDRATGNIYETSESRAVVTRITNPTIPKVYEAEFFDNGDGVAMRYLDQDENIETYIAHTSKINATSTIENQGPYQTLSGVFLPKNIVSLKKSETSNDFFYTKDGIGYTFNALTPQNQKAILNYPISNWLLDWIGEKLILTTKPSYLSEGFVFSLNMKSGNFEKILDDKKGLAVKINNNDTKIFYSESVGKSISSGILKNDTKELFLTNVKTLADKCVWSKKNINIIYCAVPRQIPELSYPDSWYQGAVSFNDNLYMIDALNNTETKFGGLDLYSFDIKDLQISDQEEYLIFQNKKDLSLWSLDITK